jgi:N-acetylglucosaminyldiphosphoundecaprenol N-acetyl-beta-D-mannosaminyltransferase
MSELTSPRSAVILGVPFHDITMDETIARLAAIIKDRTPVYWATANLDFALQASKDVELQRILVEADLVLCDGTPLVWASRALGAPLRERVAGSDLVPRIAAEAAARGWKLFLLGGGEEALPLALSKLRERHPGLQVDGYSPPFAKLLEMDFEAISDKLSAARPDVLFVAFGCPKQEKWIYMHYRRLGVPMSVGVGATVDFLAGKFRRAPRWMQVVGAEWIFRLSQEPRRLFNRYLFDLLFFVRALRAQRKALAVGAKAGDSSPKSADAPAPGFSPDLRIVNWEGRIDAASIAAGRVPAPAADFVAGNVIALVASGVTFIDSTGLGFLLTAYRRAVSAGGGLALVSPSPAVTGLLEAMKLSRLVTVVDDPVRARAALGLARPARPDPVATGELILPIQGELTATRVPGLTNWIEESWAARADAACLVLDVSAVRFMDSSGLGLLLRCHRMAAARTGARLILRGMTTNVRNVLRLAKVENVLTIE